MNGVDYILFIGKKYIPAFIFGLCGLFIYQTYGKIPLYHVLLETINISLITIGFAFGLFISYFKSYVIRIIYLLLNTILYISLFHYTIHYYLNNPDIYMVGFTELGLIFVSLLIVLPMLVISIPFKILDMIIAGRKKLFYSGIIAAINDNEGTDFKLVLSNKKTNNYNIFKMDIEELKILLEEKVDNELYEEAAKIRDLINQKEKK